MKIFIIATLIIVLVFVRDATSSPEDFTINNEVGSLMENLANMANIYIIELINSAITNATSFQFTEFKNILNETLEDMENSLISTMESLLQPIRNQLNYHLPLPTTSSPTDPLPNSEENPAESCKDLYSTNPNTESGYYWIQPSSGSPVRVYCKMDADCGNMTGGWMRVAYIDMTNSSHQCPSELTLLTRSEAPRRLCDVASYTCPGVHFTTHGMNYSHVYGRIKAYQNGYPCAFYYGSEHSIDERRGYVYGVSLTHGSNPRKHIWTFAGAIDESPGTHPSLICPCTNSVVNPASITIPSYVGNDYFCDTSLVNSYLTYTKELYPSDPLWDGEGCGPSSTCCSVPNVCGNSSPPWFIKHLPSSTTDDVEMRVCKPCYYGSTPIEQVEIYVQ